MNNIVKKILLISLAFWIIIAGLRTVHNIGRVFTEDLKWLRLSDDRKRAELFGDLHFLFSFVKQFTPSDAEILFLAPGGKSYFLGRYYLYPRKLTYVTSLGELQKNIKTTKYDYLLVYKTHDPVLNEHDSMKWTITGLPLITQYVAKDHRSKGELYRLE